MRVILVGEGPLPGPAARETRFASLRLASFARALADHELVLVDANDPPEAVAGDVVVSAGVYGPTRVALRLAGERPLLVDLPGDPYADAQAAAAVGADPEAVATEADRVFGAALRRGDHFTAVSGPSRFAVLGALGAVGRSARVPAGEERIDVVPVAWDFGGLPERAPRPPARPLRVALTGSFNTWFDEETALTALLRVMDRAAVEVEVTGGPVPGHHEAGYARFVAGARASRHAARFRFHGWVDGAHLGAVLAGCHVGLCLDRPGWEPELGSRTRILFWLHQGLQVVATARGELCRELAAEGQLVAVPQGDPDAVVRALLELGPPLDRAPLRERYDPDRVTAPIRRWAAAPRRTTGPDPLVRALLAAERDRSELAALRATPTWRALDRLHRGLRRTAGLRGKKANG